MKHYNLPAGRPGQRNDDPPDRPHIKVPFVFVAGAWVRAEAAFWNPSKQAFWVDFGDGYRDWVAETHLAWQTVLLFPES